MKHLHNRNLITLLLGLSVISVLTLSYWMLWGKVDQDSEPNPPKDITQEERFFHEILALEPAQGVTYSPEGFDVSFTLPEGWKESNSGLSLESDAIVEYSSGKYGIVITDRGEYEPHENFIFSGPENYSHVYLELEEKGLNIWLPTIIDGEIYGPYNAFSPFIVLDQSNDDPGVLGAGSDSIPVGNGQAISLDIGLPYSETDYDEDIILEIYSIIKSITWDE